MAEERAGEEREGLDPRVPSVSALDRVISIMVYYFPVGWEGYCLEGIQSY